LPRAAISRNQLINAILSSVSFLLCSPAAALTRLLACLPTNCQVECLEVLGDASVDITHHWVTVGAFAAHHLNFGSSAPLLEVSVA
jgi:hypothetical protein